MKTNKYPGRCVYCNALVPAKGGQTWKPNYGRRWLVSHLSCAAKRGPAVSRIVLGGKEYYQNKQGRCEDAPCCGCCTI